MIKKGDKVRILCNISMDKEKYKIGSIHEVIEVHNFTSKYSNVYFTDDGNLSDAALLEQVEVIV